jgi:hypothetical protein
MNIQMIFSGGENMDSFLDNLVGKWNLRGKMNDKSLFQNAVGRWVLNGLFLELRFKATQVGKEGNPPYEAIYLIGHDGKTGNYVLNLFDTFGVTSRPVPGIGELKDNTVRFVFTYDNSLFANAFTWHPKQHSWTMLLTSEEGGKTKLFAKKEMTQSKEAKKPLWSKGFFNIRRVNRT